MLEAVVNSIHAIEEADLPPDKGRIVVDVGRESVLSLSNGADGRVARGNILNFTVTDNGIGFTDANMRSFRTLDSDYKIDMGGRGVGRLLWLKAFDNVRVDSTYADDEKTFRRRRFEFNAINGVSEQPPDDADQNADRRTTVYLSGFRSRYRESSRKQSAAIARHLLEHCLWYFIRPGSAPSIELHDEGQVLFLSDVYDEHMHASASEESVEVRNWRFDLVHVKLRANASATHTVSWCADNRLVSEEKLAGKLPGLHGRLSDENGPFVYSCYVSSRFLDERARPERTGFDIVERADGLFADTELGLEEVRDAITGRAGVHLSEHLAENLERSKKRVDGFVSTRAPRYRPILSRLSDEELNVDPDISDRDLDVTLHRKLTDLEEEFLSEGHVVMRRDESEPDEDYAKRVAVYMAKAEDLKKSDLANCVAHRRVILDLFEKAIERKPDGRYVCEDIVHNLIMPKGVDSNEAGRDSSNLWLIDERLAFHEYLASDKQLKTMPVTGSESTKRPDLFSLRIFDQPVLVSEDTQPPFASLDIVEIKRPMRADATPGEEGDPVEQAIGYLRRIRDGGLVTKHGRPIPATRDVPGFCYVLADLTTALHGRCRDHHDLRQFPDGLGYFGYKGNLKAYVEVISFDRLVRVAKERHRAFFDKLGLPAN